MGGIQPKPLGPTSTQQAVASIGAGVVVAEDTGPLGDLDPLTQPEGGALPTGEVDGEGSNVLKFSSSLPGTLGQIRGTFPKGNLFNLGARGSKGTIPRS